MLFGFLLFMTIKTIYSGKQKEKKADFENKLKKRWPETKGFLAERVEFLGGDLFQFYGKAIGGKIMPEMRVLIPGNGENSVYEVYAPDETPDKPDSEITPEMEEATMVIKNQDLNIKEIKEKIKRDGGVVLTLVV